MLGFCRSCLFICTWYFPFKYTNYQFIRKILYIHYVPSNSPENLNRNAVTTSYNFKHYISSLTSTCRIENCNLYDYDRYSSSASRASTYKLISEFCRFSMFITLQAYSTIMFKHVIIQPVYMLYYFHDCDRFIRISVKFCEMISLCFKFCELNSL